MKTIFERYESDPQFHALVDQFTHFIDNCEFTPTELREACHVAAIKWEMTHARRICVNDKDVLKAMETLDEYIIKERQKRRTTAPRQTAMPLNKVFNRPVRLGAIR